MLRTEIDATDGIALVTIDMPGRSMNVIDWALAEALQREIALLAANDAVTGIVLASGKESFIAGADLAIMKDFTGPGTSPKTAAEKLRSLADPLREMETCGKPVVAAASGTALGGGLEVMLASHYRIAARSEKAVFGLPEVKLGLLPGAGGTQRLPRLVGLAAALPLLLEGKTLSAEEAQELGFVDEVVEPEDLIPAARRALAEGRVSPVARWDEKRFAPPGPPVSANATFDGFIFANAQAHARGHGNFPALQAILSCVYEGIRLPIDKALKIERQYFGELVHGEVAQAMIRTLFFARQRLAKAGRRGPEPDAPFAASLAAACRKEAERLEAEGWSRAFIANAAIGIGLAGAPFAPEEIAAGSGGRADREELRPVGRRLLRAMALAAVEALQEGRVADADAADLDAIEGAGFPAWTGGPLTMIDTQGAESFLATCRRDGLQVPESLAEMAQSGGSFHGDKARAA